MSVTGIAAMARSFLRQTLYTSTCQRKVGGVTTGSFACFYEQTQPQAGQSLDYETGGGYGYTVYGDPAQLVSGGNLIAMDEGNAIDVDNLTLAVQRVAPLGLHDGAVRIECTRR